VIICRNVYENEGQLPHLASRRRLRPTQTADVLVVNDLESNSAIDGAVNRQLDVCWLKASLRQDLVKLAVEPVESPTQLRWGTSALERN